MFNKFDPEGFGEIPVDDFLLALRSPELQLQVPFNKIELLHHRAVNSKKPNASGVISFQEFVNVVSRNNNNGIRIVVLENNATHKNTFLRLNNTFDCYVERDKCTIEENCVVSRILTYIVCVER